MALLVDPFPAPGRRLRQAYRDLHTAQYGAKDQIKALGNIEDLPRPWIPESLPPALRAELWAWLEQVVPWLNKHYTWQINVLIPACWYRHPHLVLELVTVADLRHRAAQALTGDALEDWHRYCLPAFFERARTRLLTICEEGHQDWPGKSRQSRDQDHQDRRAGAFTTDQDEWSRAALFRTGQVLDLDHAQATPGSNQWNVDPITGEILD